VASEVPHFIDTNILLYSISPHPEEEAKRAQAEEVLKREDAALSVQVLQEFYVQATRPTRAGRLPHDLAVGLIRTWCRFRVQTMTLAIVEAALEIKAAHGFSYWDSAILAAARALGCQTLYTEDMAHGRQVEGVIITNPFR
jgi:predicted nucleic acid-binding protein